MNGIILQILEFKYKYAALNATFIYVYTFEKLLIVIGILTLLAHSKMEKSYSFDGEVYGGWVVG